MIELSILVMRVVGARKSIYKFDVNIAGLSGH